MTDQPANARGEQDKWVCEACGKVCADDEVLRGRSPFDEDILSGCPHCKCAETLVGACHATGCKREASSGEPWPDGVYRRSCSEHSLWRKEQRERERTNAPHSNARPETVQPKEPERDGRPESVVGEAVAAPLVTQGQK